MQNIIKKFWTSSMIEIQSEKNNCSYFAKCITLNIYYWKNFPFLNLELHFFYRDFRVCVNFSGFIEFVRQSFPLYLEFEIFSSFSTSFRHFYHRRFDQISLFHLFFCLELKINIKKKINEIKGQDKEPRKRRISK